MLAAVLAFACLFTTTHIAIGKFGQWEHRQSDLVQQDNDALALKEHLPQGTTASIPTRPMINLGLWLDKSCLQYFSSTAAPASPALSLCGVKRDVRSEPCPLQLYCAGC